MDWGARNTNLGIGVAVMNWTQHRVKSKDGLCQKSFSRRRQFTKPTYNEMEPAERFTSSAVDGSQVDAAESDVGHVSGQRQ